MWFQTHFPSQMEAVKSLILLRNVKHILTYFIRHAYPGAHFLHLKSVSVAQQSFPDILFINVHFFPPKIASLKYEFHEDSAETKDFS